MLKDLNVLLNWICQRTKSLIRDCQYNQDDLRQLEFDKHYQELLEQYKILLKSGNKQNKIEIESKKFNSNGNTKSLINSNSNINDSELRGDGENMNGNDIEDEGNDLKSRAINARNAELKSKSKKSIKNTTIEDNSLNEKKAPKSAKSEAFYGLNYNLKKSSKLNDKLDFST